MNAVPAPIRMATADDIPWLSNLLGEFYGSKIDLGNCERYFRNTMARPDHIYMRGFMSAAGARYGRPFWAPNGSKPIAEDIFFCAGKGLAAPLELIQVMKKLVEWAESSGCRQMNFAALNGVDVSGFAKRAGATVPIPTFTAVF